MMGRRKYLSGFKRFKYNSIFIRNFVVMTVFEVLLVCLLISLFAYQIGKNITEEIYHMNYTELERTADTLDTIVEQIENFSYYLTIDNDMKLLMMEAFESDFIQRTTGIVEKIYSFQRTFDYVSRVAVYVECYDVLIETSNIAEVKEKEKQTWISLYEKVEDQIFLMDTKIAESGFPVFLTFLYPVRNAGGEITGAVIVDINLDRLNYSLGRNARDLQRIYMISDSGQIYYANDIMEIKYPERRPGLIQQYCENSGQDVEAVAKAKKILFLTVSSETKGATYVMQVSSSIYEEMSGIVPWLLLVSMGAIVGSIIISFILTIHSYKPIQYIMDETLEGELQDGFVTGENAKNEIQFIAGQIQNAKKKNAQLTMDVANWMKQLSDAQVLALQSQINPHFLYNTLDAINWIVLGQAKEKTELASDAISALAQLLRISMSRSSYLVTLKEELDHAMLYVKLMNIRYADRIQVFWEIPEELQKEKVIRLCLQPILENAITHGFGKRRGRGTIRVLGDIVYDTLILRVVDDGVGLSADKCREMNQELITNYEMADNHVGIRNVNQRIRILFGEKYGVQVTPGETSGLVVVLGFPASNLS